CCRHRAAPSGPAAGRASGTAPSPGRSSVPAGCVLSIVVYRAASVTILGGSAAHKPGKDAVELCVAPEASVHRGVHHGPTPPMRIQAHEAIEALPVSKGNQREAHLLFEQATQVRWAESHPMR